MTKSSNITSSSLGPQLGGEICQEVTNSRNIFTVMLNETAAVQNNQMDVLIRFWSESEHLVVTKYLVLFFFT